MMHASGYEYDDRAVEALLRAQRPGYALDRALYVGEDAFRADMDRIFGRHWLYVGHGCMVPNAGDWITWKIGHDNVIVVRGRDGEVRAFHNACRHRGARLCREEQGSGRTFTCPYHAWSYDLQGRNLTPTEREFGVHQSELGLRPVHLRDAAGLLFISLADRPPSFEDAQAEISRRLRPHGMDRAKVAHHVEYKVKANWKLVFENNRECYHCPPNHPEYLLTAYDVIRQDPKRAEEVRRRTEEANAHFVACGLDTGDVQSTMSGAFWRAHRTPLTPGFVTQSMDGKPVSTLMGDLKHVDAGTLRITVFPNFWQHASSDHAVATRITPVGPAECRVDVWWLVDREAQAGRDYTLERLLPVWERTSEQDWFICEENQAGVSTSRYAPSPYGKTWETNVDHFVRWYVGEMLPAPPHLRAAV